MNSGAEGPPVEEKTYNQTYQGVYGEFGAAAHAQIVFLQTAIRPSQLDQLTLISEIPGSETWSVRDLFQREVDTSRVTKSILPYFQNKNKVKFFNPLTLTLLPIDTESFEILSDPPELTEGIIERNGRRWKSLEAEDYFRYRHVDGQMEWGALDWNDESVKIVAIDGQHRLSALKRFKEDTAQGETETNFSQWNIPVVTLAVKPLQKDRRRSTILEVVRNIFVYINKEAKQPTRARQILLSDESINAICAQEILEYAHENDVKSLERRDAERVPLLLFDWRGPQEGSEESPAAVVGVEEVHDWLETYILGEDFSTEQKTALGVQPVDDLHDVFRKSHLPVNQAKAVRDRFNERLRSGVLYLLENFQPYQEYIASLRDLEAEYRQQSDIARHAFHKLRFGSHRAGQDEQGQVESVYQDICDEIEREKGKIPDLIRRDIGMRGVMFAFGALYTSYKDCEISTDDYLEYAKWFTHACNCVYEDRWFDLTKTRTENILQHIVIDSNENIVNYRLGHAESAFGALLACLVGAYGRSETDVPEAEEWGEINRDLARAVV